MLNPRRCRKKFGQIDLNSMEPHIAEKFKQYKTKINGKPHLKDLLGKHAHNTPLNTLIREVNHYFNGVVDCSFFSNDMDPCLELIQKNLLALYIEQNRMEMEDEENLDHLIGNIKNAIQINMQNISSADPEILENSAYKYFKADLTLLEFGAVDENYDFVLSSFSEDVFQSFIQYAEQDSDSISFARWNQSPPV